jgi:hypothetical protein
MTKLIRLTFVAALLTLMGACEGLEVKPLPPEMRPPVADPVI